MKLGLSSKARRAAVCAASSAVVGSAPCSSTAATATASAPCTFAAQGKAGAAEAYWSADTAVVSQGFFAV